MQDRRFGHSYVFVSCTVVEQIALAAFHHAFHEHNIGHLADFFPVLFRLQDGPIATPKQFPWILAIEDRDAGALHELIVRAVIDENNSVRCKNGGRSGLRHA